MDCPETMLAPGLLLIARRRGQGCRSAARSTYIHEQPSARKLLVPAASEPPRSGCPACGRATLTLKCDTRAMTLRQLVAGVAKKALAVVTPMLLCGDFLYEEGEGLEPDEVAANEALLPKVLVDLPGGGIRSGALLHLTDEAQAFNVDLAIVHQDEALDAEVAPEGWVLEGLSGVPAPTALPAAPLPDEGHSAAPPQPVAKPAAAALQEDDDGALILSGDEEEAVPAPATALAGGKKRGRDGGDGDADAGPSGAKKGRLEAAPQRLNVDLDNGEEVITLD